MYAPYYGYYAASKAAMQKLGETLRLEMQPLGVRVITVVSGAVESKVFDNGGGFKSPEGSLYAPAEKEIAAHADGVFVKQNHSTLEDYSRVLVGDILGGKTGLVYRGKMSSLVKVLLEWLPTWLFALTHEQEIRLLKIERCGSEPLFSISHYSLEDAPRYEALSYVWGSSDQPHRLQLARNAGYIPLTDNLKQALQDLPWLLETEHIWIDQICINQRDETERGHQVALMGKLYRATHRTLVWLSPMTDSLSPFLDLVKYRQTDWRAAERIIDSMVTSPESCPQLIHGMRKLFGLPWFKRAWILQESALPSTIHYVVGRECFNWRSIVDVALGLHITYPEDLSAFVTYRFGHHTWRGCGSEETVQGLALQLCRILARLGRQQQATDPRDRVVAYLGFYKPPSFRTRDIYHKDITAGEVYVRFARSLIEDTSSLDVLSSARPGVSLPKPCGAGLVDLPSWVPDWSDPEEHHFPLLLHEQSRYTASGMYRQVKWAASLSRSHVRQSVRSPLDARYLRCRGKIIHMVQHTSGYTLPSPNSWSYLQYELLEHWRTLLGHVRAEIPFKDMSVDRITEVLWLAHSLYSSPGEEVPGNPDVMSKREGIDWAFMKWQPVFDHLWGRMFMKTESGSVGLVTTACNCGDLIAIFHGSRTPLVVRKISSSSNYQLVGDCYIEGAMFGEAVGWTEEEADDIVIE
ncbi:hypothetical protein SLS55_010315 [Diplodia seriata]|uniref:Heterokaryon incompatibility domain-containing protein n=1 Tax=Diplodia seriata TaxID=420778 RepID=A0ABR3BY73_9PEZI